MRTEKELLNLEDNLHTDEIAETMNELGSVLQKIRNRLIKEGYRIEDGVLYSPDGSVEYRGPKR
ncbi:MAG: hypothetical protein KGI58_02140 [Patescibacteria group bacterium]|nr:hypothetical protein [Patescibacteria group bacterium]